MAIKAKTIDEEKGFEISIKDALEDWIAQKTEDYHEDKIKALDDLSEKIHQQFHDSFKMGTADTEMVEFYILSVAISLVKTMECAEPIVNGEQWDSTSTVH